jgi:hypothetical protein
LRNAWNRAEFAGFAAFVVDRVDRFYKEIRKALTSRAAVETAFSAWAQVDAQRMHKHLEAVRTAIRAASAQGLEGAAAGAFVAAEVRRTSEPFPNPQVELRSALKAAKILPPWAPLKNLRPERGAGAGGWAGNTRVEVLVAGQPVARKRPLADQTRSVVVDLLAPEWLDILYKNGPRKAALAVGAKVVGRSPAQVEHLIDAVRAGEANESPDAR